MGIETILGAVAGPVIGGLMGGSGGSSQTQKQELDPRIQGLLFGDYKEGGLLGDINSLYKNQLATGGLNPWQQAGLEAQRQVLTHPSYTQGFDSMRSLGMGLMGGGMAANPFTSGGGGGGGGLIGQAQAIRPSGPGFGYDMSKGGLMGATNPIGSMTAPAPAAPAANREADDYLAELMRQDKLRREIEAGYLTAYDRG